MSPLEEVAVHHWASTLFGFSTLQPDAQPTQTSVIEAYLRGIKNRRNTFDCVKVKDGVIIILRT
jgi:hypothetical protein